MALNFTAVDFETANYARASACQLGAAIVRDGQVVDRHEWLIRPVTGMVFTNTRIHGIGPEHVQDAPDYVTVLRELLDLSRGSMPLVSYGSFDREVVRAVHGALQIPAPPSWLWRDALTLTRGRLTLERYRLVDVARHLGVELVDHHQAGADALACAQVVLRVAERAECDDLGDLWFNEPAKPAARNMPYKPNPKPNGQADAGNPLFGRAVCFTGKLDQLTRSEAKQLAASLGAKVVDAPSKKTAYLVEGEFNPLSLKQGDTLSSKAQKAIQLAEAGHPIQIIDELTFLDLVEDWC